MVWLENNYMGRVGFHLNSATSGFVIGTVCTGLCILTGRVYGFW